MARLRKLLRRLGIRRHGANHRERAVGADAADAEFRIPNMVCDGCAERIDGLLRSIPGVQEIKPNVRQKRIRVHYEPTKVDAEALKQVLATAGFAAVDAESP